MIRLPASARAFVAALALLSAAVPAEAAAPQPRKPLELERLLGRWYEIARTPNPNQRDCQGATSDWIRKGPDRFEVVQTCRKGSPSGPARVMKCAATLVDAVTNAKWRLSFFGGAVKQEYWLIDRADDHSWMLFGTPGGNYVWILSRRPVMSDAGRQEALGRAQQLGYDIRRLVFPAVAHAAL